MKMKSKQHSKIEAIDLFCGAGGLSAGLKKQGITIKAGVDIDPYCEYPFVANHKNAVFLFKDIAQVKGRDISKHWSKNSRLCSLSAFF
jgi:DNA (cytosine-5)-methyltransferase 1